MLLSLIAGQQLQDTCPCNASSIVVVCGTAKVLMMSEILSIYSKIGLLL
jgi:hypothetical protein